MQKGVWQSMLLHWRDPDLDRSFTCISLLISRCLVHEALRHVSWSVLSESQEGGGKLTCFSSPLSALHSSATSLLFSLRTIPLKSVLWIRSLKKKVQAELGRFTRRSSSMCWVWLGAIGTLRGPPKALF